MPSASWVSDARSESTPLARFSTRAAGVLAAGLLAIGPMLLSAPVGAQSPPRGMISLTSQDPWVQNSNDPVRLGLKVRSAVAPEDLLVSVALYTEPDQSALASRDEFDATLEGQLVGLDQLKLAKFSLNSVMGNHGLIKIYVGGSELPGRVPKIDSATQAVFELPCPALYGGCGGVYPLEVSLDDVQTGQPIDSFTTYLTVVPSPVTAQKRLRFSFVVPIGASVALTTSGMPVLDKATLSEIDTIAGAEASRAKVPLSIDLYGQQLLALARAPKHTKLLDTVAYAGLDTLVTAPFSSVDPTRLVRSGLEGDLTSQIERGAAVFSNVLHRSRPPELYIATSLLGTRALAALAADGIKYVVVPKDNLESISGGQPASAQWPYTLSAPFHIAGSSVEGLQSDPDLGAHLSGTESPALRAQQLLADLAEIFYDSPYFPDPRGVALVAPEPWAPQAKFLDALLRGLSSSPIITTVPVSEIFSIVPVGTCQLPSAQSSGCSPEVRSLISPQLSGDGTVTSSQLQSARTHLGELSSVIPTAPTTIAGLSDGILLAETTGLSQTARQEYLSAPLAMMLRLGAQLGLPTGRTVTVTSSSARFPIAITSSSRTAVHAVLVISGQDLSSATNMRVVLKRGTTSFIVRVHTRTSGDSNLQLQLFSPSGHVQLARAELTIRSTAISGVAIALTAGAAAFLLFWWFRSISRRHRRRARHRPGQAQQQTSETVQEPAS
ncbi:MAG: DUF6049 family protein [Acidimicrobiales bacterium]